MDKLVEIFQKAAKGERITIEMKEPIFNTKKKEFQNTNKYKMWDKFCQGWAIASIDLTYYGDGRLRFFLGDRYIVVQYIGYTDKHNAEIYQGDIVQDSFDRIMLVEYVPHLGRNMFRALTDTNFKYADLFEWFVCVSEKPIIIGNIFEIDKLKEKLTEIKMPSNNDNTANTGECSHE